MAAVEGAGVLATAICGAAGAGDAGGATVDRPMSLRVGAAVAVAPEGPVTAFSELTRLKRFAVGVLDFCSGMLSLSTVAVTVLTPAVSVAVVLMLLTLILKEALEGMLLLPSGTCGMPTCGVCMVLLSMFANEGVGGTGKSSNNALVVDLAALASPVTFEVPNLEALLVRLAGELLPPLWLPAAAAFVAKATPVRDGAGIPERLASFLLINSGEAELSGMLAQTSMRSTNCRPWEAGRGFTSSSVGSSC